LEVNNYSRFIAVLLDAKERQNRRSRDSDRLTIPVKKYEIRREVFAHRVPPRVRHRRRNDAVCFKQSKSTLMTGKVPERQTENLCNICCSHLSKSGVMMRRRTSLPAGRRKSSGMVFTVNLVDGNHDRATLVWLKTFSERIALPQNRTFTSL